MRYGKFTSSEIGKLIPKGRNSSFSVAGLTYIQTKAYERLLGRSISGDTNAKSTSWGLLAEKYVFDILGLDYQPMGDEPIVHPKYNFWAGSPDAFNHRRKALIEIKCPYTLKSFCDLAEAKRIGLDGIEAITFIRENHSEGDMYYWQMVSNCVLTETNIVEFIFFCPKMETAMKIQSSAASLDEEWQNKFRNIYFASLEELPYLPENSSYEELNVIEFEVPEEDMELLERRVIEANDQCLKIINQKGILQRVAALQ